MAWRRPLAAAQVGGRHDAGAGVVIPCRIQSIRSLFNGVLIKTLGGEFQVNDGPCVAFSREVIGPEPCARQVIKRPAGLTGGHDAPRRRRAHAPLPEEGENFVRRANAGARVAYRTSQDALLSLRL